jgi:hypothetical protein
MMFLKVMSEQDMPDSAAEKNFTLWQIPDDAALSFSPSEATKGGVEARWFTTEEGLRVVPLTGNAYVLNAQGKTIANRASY